MTRARRYDVSIVGSFGTDNEFGDEASLVFKVGKSGRGFEAAVNGLKFGSLGFFMKNLWGDEWLVLSRWASNRFERGMPVENCQKNRVEKAKIRLQ